MTMEEDNNQLKIAYQHCNGFVTCKIRSGYPAGMVRVGAVPVDLILTGSLVGLDKLCT